MTKYKIYQITSPNGEWFYCKEKFGPFWLTPWEEDLRYGLSLSHTKNSKCRRFKTKEALLEVISRTREKELASKKYKQDQLKTKHIPLEEV